MAKKRGSRAARFATLRGFYSTFKAGLLNDEAATANVNATGFVIYESEVERFAQEFPDIDIDDFVDFCKNHSAYKIAGKKMSTGKRAYKLNTPEKAASVGVAPEDIDKYIQLMDMGYKWRDEMQKLIPNGTVTISIPNRNKNNGAETDVTVGEDTEAPGVEVSPE